MSQNDVYKNYLVDLVTLLLDEASEAKKDKDTEKSDFSSGQLMAYYSVISLMRDQAEAFGISLAEINLDTINPDKDLL